MKNFKMFESKSDLQRDLNDDLLIASDDGDLNKVKELISLGADIETKDKYGYTPLNNASLYGNLEVVKHLISVGADIETESNGSFTPLNNASYKGHLEVVKYLISVGVDIETKSYNGHTPLNNASYNGHLEVIKYLISVGADIETKSSDGYTPLDYNQEKIWSTKEIQELLIKQNPMNISILKKHGIPIHPDIKEEHEDLDLGSELGTI